MTAAEMRGESLELAKTCILGKIYNARWILERAIRDHGMQIGEERVKEASQYLKTLWNWCAGACRRISCVDMKERRPVFILAFLISLFYSRRKIFLFQGRSRRPPLDPVNALLSFCIHVIDQYSYRCTGNGGTGSIRRISSYRPAWQGIARA